MTCPHCTAAEQRGLSYGNYDHNRCAGCAARALARSRAAEFAFLNGRPLDLRDAVQRTFRRTPFDAAMAMVRRWWDLDHGVSK